VGQHHSDYGGGGGGGHQQEDASVAGGGSGDTVPLQKQPSTDQQTDSEQSQPTTVTSHLSLPHFAIHRQVAFFLFSKYIFLKKKRSNFHFFLFSSLASRLVFRFMF